MRFCAWVDKRLPTPEEWQLAAAGPEGRTYPWGEEEPTDEHLCWKRGITPCPVGSKPKGATPLGLLDMAGNVQELSSGDGCWLKKPNIPCVLKSPLVHGGAWNACVSASRCHKPGSFTTVVAHFQTPDTVGFRCARTAPQ